MKRLLIMLVAAAALAAGGLPASAASGGWALTYLDPLPAELEPGVTYTVGFWVLQHGTHPYEGDDLGKTGLRLSGGDGRVLTFDGAALPEAGHFAAAVAVPKGTWKVVGVQGWFAPYVVGTLTVPGAMKINPLPAELLANGPRRDHADDHWGAVRPPGFPPGKAGPVGYPAAAVAADRGAAPDQGAVPSQAAVSGQGAGAPEGAAAPVSESAGFPPYALLVAGVGGALLALAVLRLPRRGRREEEPVDDKTDTIVISG